MASRSPSCGARMPGALPGALLGATLAAGSGSAACGGSVSSEALTEAIERELRAQGLVASVVCPPDVEARAGARVTCTAIAADDPGRTELVVRAEILEADRISLEPEAALAIGRAAPAIRRALAGLGIAAERIDCGVALVRPGASLGCDIDASGGRRYRWEAVMGGDGHARGELVPR